MPMGIGPVSQMRNLYRDSVQHNQKNSDIHGRFLFKPLVLKKLLCTDLIYGWCTVSKVSGERILVLLKVFVPWVTTSAVMSLKTSLCDGFVILSGQRMEEPFSETGLCSNQHYTCQIPFRM